MNIYRIEMSFEIENCDIAWSVDYVMHEKKFTQDEFDSMCLKALEKCKDKTMYDLKLELTKDGFSNIEPVARFEFAED